MKTDKLPAEVFDAACKFQLLNKSTNYNCQKITDGVSSDIWYVKTEKNREFCIKRALAKLTVKEDWYAPISRNKFEAMYFQNCFKIAPQSTVVVNQRHDCWECTEMGPRNVNWQQQRKIQNKIEIQASKNTNKNYKQTQMQA